MVSTISLTNKAGETGGWTYTYDDNGNIATVKTTTSAGSNTITYTYDTAGQLIREDNPAEYSTTVWTYDNAGNILSEKLYMYTTGTPSELMETNSYTYGNANWGDLLTKYNGQTISYDTIGNPLTYNNGTAWTFTWEHGRQLATMSDGTSTWTNTYNSDGLRTSRTDGTTTYTYYYEEGRLSAIKRNDLNMWIIYDENGPVTLKYGVGTFHYVTNLQGDVVAIVGADGRKLVEYTYDAWGKVTSITGDYAYNLGIHNPILYRGYIYDHETGFYYCQSRYYDPEIGRWINADSAISGTGGDLLGYNMFAYCFNNPVNMSDPTGNWPEWLEELGSRFVHGLKIMGRIAASPFKAMSAEVGAGIGIGIKAKAVVNNVPIEVGAVTSVTDSVSYEEGKFDARNTTSTHVGINFAGVFDFSHSNGREHSYFDERCTCDFISSTYGQKSNCVANESKVSNKATLGFSVGGYLLLGGEVSISVDLAAWNKELLSIYHESIAYGK